MSRPRRPWDLVTARPWQAKSRPRQMAEAQYVIDRQNSHYAKEGWKTMEQLMYNDLYNAMDSHEMVSKHGPANWGPELMTMGALNNELAALSTIPAYVPRPSTFPVPMVNPAMRMMGAMAAIPRVMPPPMAGMLPVPPVIAPAPIMGPMPLPAVMGPAAVPMAPSFVNNVPVSVSPQIIGFSVIAVLGPVEAVAPAAVHFDVALQRLTAVEGVAEKAAMMGGDGVVNLRLVTTPLGDVVAAGDIVKLMPLM